MEKISVSDFLIQELSKIGIKDFFGLPGDYNFNIIDSIENNSSTNWIGCTNELNAGYAADGYARVNGYGALVTTYNVGELSAINAIAGSFAENVPVISIVGLPKTKFIKDCTLLHHNFINPDYYAALNAYSKMTEYAVILDESNAKKEIEKAISIFIKEKKPVYIAIPADVCNLLINNDNEIEEPRSNENELKKALEHILKKIKKAVNPVVIGDCLIDRFDAKKEFNNFIANSGIPCTTLIMGKGLINESLPNFLDTYLGSLKNFKTYETIQKSDCIIFIGAILSDLNTLKFEITFEPCNCIEINGNQIKVENETYKDVLMKDILKELAKEVKLNSDASIKKNIECLLSASENKRCDFAFSRYQEALSENDLPSEDDNYSFLESDDSPLNFDYIQNRFKQFIRPGDYIFTDTGILSYLIPPMKLPDDCRLYTQLLWASIGWATPAVFGACMADKSRRVILLTGEGSHQLTIQEISNMFYRGVKPIIFVLNNSGYTIERLLSKNAEDDYNNIIPWNYAKLFEAFDPDACIEQVRTNNEFDKMLKRIEEESLNRICYVEMFTDKMDLPVFMRKFRQRIIEDR